MSNADGGAFVGRPSRTSFAADGVEGRPRLSEDAPRRGKRPSIAQLPSGLLPPLLASGTVTLFAGPASMRFVGRGAARFRSACCRAAFTTFARSIFARSAATRHQPEIKLAAVDLDLCDNHAHSVAQPKLVV